MNIFSQTILSIFISAILYLIIFINKKRKLPPGPLAFPILGNLLWLRHSVSFMEPILCNLFQKYGPIVTIHIGSRPMIFIKDRSIAHKALIEHGATFSDRPTPSPATRFVSNNQPTISSAGYSPLWRLFRRNLMSEILHTSRVKIYGEGRDWVLDVLIKDLSEKSKNSEDGGSVVVKDSIRFAMFCLLVLMCFGEKLDEKRIGEIEKVHRDILLYLRKLNVVLFFPKIIAKYLFSDRWKAATDLRRKQMDALLPLINARREHKSKQKETEERFVYSYLDSLLDIKLPDEEDRNLTEDEMVSLCSEFLFAGTDTTWTALQWIMAELVKNEHVQKKLVEEIESVVEHEGRVKEEELNKMPYLKAVVLEGLRRHPPGHFVLPHSVTQEIEIEGYVIPKNAEINFMIAEMGWDEKTWDDPMEFKPERFLNGGDGEAVDITGSREIKMMPFGAGRRICPGLALGMLHLEFFVANLIREFEWKCVEGDKVDLSEISEFHVAMKYPLRARLIARRS